MMKKVFIITALALAALMAFGCTKKESKYPARTITIAAPNAAGGGTDLTARNMAQGVKSILGVDIVVKNFPAGNAVGISECYTAKADGYTVGIAPVEIVLLPLMGQVPWKTEEFEPIIMANAAPAAFSVRADSPYKTAQDFIKAANGNPGNLKVGGSPVGTIWNLSALGFANTAGIDVNIIPYSGGAAPSVQDLLGGNLDATVVGGGEVSDQVAAGMIRILCIMSEQRDMTSYPNVPTCREEGVDIISGTWWGFFAPPKTPEAELAVLRDAFEKSWHSEEYQTFLKKQKLVPMFKNADDAVKFMNEQKAAFTPLLDEVDLLKK